MMGLRRLFKTSAFRLSAIYMLLILLAAVIIGGLISWRTNRLITQQLIETISTEIDGLSRVYKRGGNIALAQTISSRSRQPGSGLYYFGNGAGLKISGNLSAVPAVFDGGKSAQEFTYRSSGAKNAKLRSAVGVPFVLLGKNKLIVARDIQDQKDFSSAARKIFFSGLGAIVLFVLGTGLFMGWRLLNRVEAVNKTSALIMAGDLSERLPIDGSGDEIDRLSLTFNQMLERIERLMHGLTQVSDNIAHDLKTPLNRLRNKAEAALLKGGDQANDETLGGIIDEADRLIDIFESLLKIARLEAGGLLQDRKPVALHEVVRDVLELYEPALEDRGVQVNIGHVEETIILADRQLVAQSITNIISNVLKYGANDDESKQGQLDVFLSIMEPFARLTIADFGVGIPKADRDRVLERFVRLEASRTKQGSGLGLSMVVAILKAVDGRLSLKETDEKNKRGLTVQLDFPLVSSEDLRPNMKE